MRPIALVATAFALALGTSAIGAQQPAINLPDTIPFGVPVGLAQALTIVADAQAEAEKRSRPMNIAIVDTFDDLVHFARMDGAQLVSMDVSPRKARTATRWRRETQVIFEAYGKGPPIYGTLHPSLAASPGGLPRIVEGKLIGAVGCSGGTSDQDVVVCQAGIDALT